MRPVTAPGFLKEVNHNPGALFRMILNYVLMLILTINNLIFTYGLLFLFDGILIIGL